MEKSEVKKLLHAYFNGFSTLKDEQRLKGYFLSGIVDEEFEEYSEFFNGISGLNSVVRDEEFERETMELIIKKDKNNNRKIIGAILSIAASVVIVIGGIMFARNGEGQFYKDSFDDPDVAYAYAEKTLEYVSEKYNKGIEGLSSFNKLEEAAKPLKEGVEPVNKYLGEFEKIITE